MNENDEDGKDQFGRWIGGPPTWKEWKKASNKLELGLRSFLLKGKGIFVSIKYGTRVVFEIFSHSQGIWLH